MIFLAVISRDEQGLPVPIIIGYAEALGFNKKNIIDKQDTRYSEWNDRFPYYIEYANGRVLNAPIKHGVSLLDLYRDIGANTFPSTRNDPNIKAEQIRIRHHQKSHLQITEEAKGYLLSRLDERFKQYGCEELK